MNLAQPIISDQVDLSAPEARAGLAKIISNLFDIWQLTTDERLVLLGLSPKSRSALTGYKKGKPLSDSRDTLDRVGMLLSIHKALGLLFPKNPQIKYSWIKRRNKHFDNLTPLEVMLSGGIIGIARVARLLDFLRGR